MKIKKIYFRFIYIHSYIHTENLMKKIFILKKKNNMFIISISIDFDDNKILNCIFYIMQCKKKININNKLKKNSSHLIQF